MMGRMPAPTLALPPLRMSAAALLLIAAVAGAGWLLQPRRAPAEAPGATAGCTAPEHPRLQGGLHLLGDAQPPERYSSVPPTSGWHTAGRPRVAVQPPGRPLSEPQQVSVLEAGGVVVTYGGAADTVAALAPEIAARFAERVALTPYDRLPDGAVVFTAWGVLQRCTRADVAALEAFVATYAPDPVTAGHPAS